ncbi:MAG TPA: response regulator transcription factor [Chitinophagaceae bacterium]
MRFLFTRKVLLLLIAAACLIFAIRMFELGFNTGQVSTKVYITIIGVIFLGAGAFVGVQLARRKTIVTYIHKQPEIHVENKGILTDRETEVLKGIAEGRRNKEIAEVLFVSENTVKKHINNIYFKLDVNRRTQAVAKAKRLNIIKEKE